MNDSAYMGVPGVPRTEDDNIMRRRWESEQLIDSLFLLLAGHERKVVAGEVKLLPVADAARIMNIEGAKRVIQVVRAFVNPVVSLSRLEDADARELFYNSYMATIEALVEEKERYGIETNADFEFISATIQPLIFAQVMRAVDGWEGKNSKTQYAEGENRQTVTQGGGFKLPGFGGNK